jgi:hypothetical protein
MPLEDTMRSELIFAALAHVPNRFLLTRLAATATRKLHRPNTRIQETMDQVLVRFGNANPRAGMQGTSSVQPIRRAEKAGTSSRNSRGNHAAA